MGIKEIEMVLFRAVQKYLGIVPENEHENLLLLIKYHNKRSVDLLYVFDVIEKETGVLVKEILADKNYQVMTIFNLANRISEHC